MNASDNRQIDRLVDGALGEDERRDLLAALDSDASGDGWRRLALAFLEAQSWADALAPLARDRAPARPSCVTDARPAPRGRLRTWAGRLAAAAAVAAAFTLGRLTHEPTGSAPAPDTRAVIADRGTGVGRPTDVVKPTNLVTTDTPSPALDPEPADETGPPDPSISDELLGDWQRRGFRVERSRREVPVGLANGARVTMPVDEVWLKYEGDRTY